MKTFLPYISPYKFKISLQMFIKFAGTIFDLLIPWILSYIIDNVVAQGNKKSVYFWGLLMLLCSAGALIFNIIANRMASKISCDITEKIRHDLFSKIMNLSCQQSDEFTQSSLISRLTSDTHFFYQMMLRMQRLGIRAPILLIGGCTVTLMLDAKLALVLISLLPVLFTIVFLISKKGVGLYTKVQQASDILVRTIREFMSGIRVILALSTKEYETQRFRKANETAANAEQKAGYVMASSSPAMSFIMNMGLVLAIAVGAYLVNKGETQAGKIIAFMTYFTIILNAIMSITRIFVMLSKGTASGSRIAKVLQSENELEYTVKRKEHRKGTLSHIELRNVSFSYDGNTDVLCDISFKVEKGQTVGVIGATGSGKSTLLMLLLRFYDAENGEILIDGVNIKSIEKKKLYKKFATVFQNDILFSDSIGDNIKFGRKAVPCDMKQAVKAAQASFIYEKDGQFEHKLDIGGRNLSGGQRQRVAIARALTKRAEILLLDDVSSALDYRTDSKLRKAIEESYAETTKIIVSQRASAVMNCDNIIVLDNGEITGKGTHSELLKSNHLYREIYDIQMGSAVI
ncbi:MAG TPA: ABC transporter ATP-binding protein [Oscillospiraceae bacterium]|nr:ABC transporter ATP-binding protein [Oscillospiraceae bacterium]